MTKLALKVMYQAWKNEFRGNSVCNYHTFSYKLKKKKERKNEKSQINE